ncbi:MAG: hypothetical protein AABY33_01500 [Pseudomonadota bacterium]
MSEWKFTDIFKPLTALFQPTTTSDNRSVDGNKPHNGDTYCKYGGVKESDIHPSVEWLIKEVDIRKKASAEKSPEQFPELEAGLMQLFSNFMNHNYNDETMHKNDHLFRAMEKARIAGGIPPENVYSTYNNEKVYRHDDNKTIGNLVEQVDLMMQNIIKEYFGAKDAEILKDISIGRNLLKHVRTKCVQEANITEHDVPSTDAIGQDITAPNIPVSAKSGNKSASVQ